MAGAEGTVLGHYVATTTGGLLGKAVGSWSTPLFNSVTQDDLRALEQLVAADAPIGEPIVSTSFLQAVPLLAASNDNPSHPGSGVATLTLLQMKSTSYSAGEASQAVSKML